MDTSRLFTAALQLREPWKVGSVDFRDGDDGRQEPRIGIGFEEGSRFRCPEPGCRQDGCPVHDTRGRVWRHLNFFRYKAFIHAGVPRVTCPEHGVRTVPVPWARPGSGFTLLFEAWAVGMARHLPVGTLAEQVDETDTRLWRSVARYVGEARDLEDYTGVEAIGIDGTGRKGRHCITVVADLVERDVINVTAGKDPSTVKRFVDDFTAHNGVPGYVRLVACDMSLGFRKGIRGYLPDAGRIVDRFHVVRHANEAVDRVRKAEGRSNGPLKRTKYLWPGNESGLGEPQSEAKHALMKQRLKTGRACRMRETLQDVYETGRTPAEARVRLHRLCSWMMHSRLEPMKDLARMIRRHWNEIPAYFTHPYTNAVLEGADSVIQNIRRRARGFRNMDYFATMVYLTCGKLDLKAVTA